MSLGMLIAAASLFGFAAAVGVLAYDRSQLKSVHGRIRTCIEDIVHRRRVLMADAQLPEALALFGNALKAGLSLQQAMALAASEIPPPLGEVLRDIEAAQRMGRDFDSAFASLAERVFTEDAALIVQSVEVLRRTGGNLVQTFASLSRTIDQRRRVKDRIRSLTAQGRAQAALLLALPWCLFAALAALAPEFANPLYSTRPGLALILLALAMEGAGAIWLGRIVSIKV